MGRSLDELTSYMKPLAERLIELAIDAGLHPIVEDTGRTPDEQKMKLAQGVSWTTRSKHLPQPPEMLSEAIDIVPSACISLKYWGWNGDVGTSHPHWGRLIEIGESLGLHNGVHFPVADPGHFQYVHPPTQSQTDPELSTT